MNNEHLKAAVAELGNRLSVIYMDNNHKLFFGYRNGDDCWSASDIRYKTWNGEDFFGCSQKSGLTQDRDNGVTYTVWHRTDCIQAIAAMDEGYEDYRMDAFIW